MFGRITTQLPYDKEQISKVIYGQTETDEYSQFLKAGDLRKPTEADKIVPDKKGENGYDSFGNTKSIEF